MVYLSLIVCPVMIHIVIGWSILIQEPCDVDRNFDVENLVLYNFNFLQVFQSIAVLRYSMSLQKSQDAVVV